jgi:hypothetical protein
MDDFNDWINENPHSDFDMEELTTQYERNLQEAYNLMKICMNSLDNTLRASNYANDLREVESCIWRMVDATGLIADAIDYDGAAVDGDYTGRGYSLMRKKTIINK